MPHERGWFFHFVNLRTGAREWNSELSSIDSALLLAGVLTVRQCFAADGGDPARWPTRSIGASTSHWMLAGDPLLLSHGWKPESGFLASRWDHYCELMILYLLAHRIADAPDSRRVLARLAAADDHLRELLVHRWTAAAVRASVRARLGRFPRLAETRRAAARRLVRELGDRHARAPRLLL